MPFAQRGYPRAGKEVFEQTFPADFISEAMDQTRGWFYSLLAVSTLLFKQNAYRNVICLGLVLDPRGQKASKSRGNVLDPNYLFDNFGSDAVRWYFYTSSPVGENYRTGADTLKDTVQQFLLPLWNCYAFHVNYAVVDGFDPGRAQVPPAERPVLDRWLLSRLAGLVKTVDSELADYDVNSASRPIQAFVDDLSKWYIRRSRNRFWKSQSDTDKLAAYQTLQTALVTVARLLAPFAPFVADAIHRNLTGGSAHLADFPTVDASAIDPTVEEHGRTRLRANQGAAAAALDRGARRSAPRGDRGHHPG
jgi:isoleucyl-tRNA synthetase